MMQDSEDGTQYVMTVKQKDNQGGESSKEVRFSKYTDQTQVRLSQNTRTFDLKRKYVFSQMSLCFLGRWNMLFETDRKSVV